MCTDFWLGAHLLLARVLTALVYVVLEIDDEHDDDNDNEKEKENGDLSCVSRYSIDDQMKQSSTNLTIAHGVSGKPIFLKIE